MTKFFARALSAATLVAALAGGVAALPSAASAHDWAYHHPARVELNHRIAHQRHRIAMERREGLITRGQARAMRADDHAIRMEERADARADHNHGHLNRYQARQLNHQLNASSRTIGG